MTNRKPRETETRATTQRRKPWTPPSNLEAPDAPERYRTRKGSHDKKVSWTGEGKARRQTLICMCDFGGCSHSVENVCKTRGPVQIRSGAALEVGALSHR